jgi:hypothetical protein
MLFGTLDELRLLFENSLQAVIVAFSKVGHFWINSVPNTNLIQNWTPKSLEVVGKTKNNSAGDWETCQQTIKDSNDVLFGQKRRILKL